MMILMNSEFLVAVGADKQLRVYLGSDAEGAGSRMAHGEHVFQFKAAEDGTVAVAELALEKAAEAEVTVEPHSVKVGDKIVGTIDVIRRPKAEPVDRKHLSVVESGDARTAPGVDEHGGSDFP